LRRAATSAVVSGAVDEPLWSFTARQFSALRDEQRLLLPKLRQLRLGDGDRLLGDFPDLATRQRNVGSWYSFDEPPVVDSILTPGRLFAVAVAF
jgi:hypothetical protein